VITFQKSMTMGVYLRTGEGYPSP